MLLVRYSSGSCRAREVTRPSSAALGASGESRMIEALLHGKLSHRQENMEDILTSNVFGLLQYVSPELGLFKFLAEATTCEGDQPLKRLTSDCVVRRDAIEYEFWPFWAEGNGDAGCEPDVVVFIPCDDAMSYLLGIEAKYRSGKSSEADEEADCPTDQLAREWHGLVQRARSRNARPLLVYLTADVNCPKDQIHSSVADCRKRAACPTEPVIAWLTWRQLSRLFQRAADRHLRDIADLAKKMNLIFFEGISPLASIRVDWRFEALAPQWRFEVAPFSCRWRFKP